MKYKFILLDADNTLFDFDACEEEAFFRTMQAMEIQPSQALYARYNVINDACWKALERGELTRENLKIKRFAELADSCQLDFDPSRAALLYVENLANANTLIPGSTELLCRLHQWAKVYIITNGLYQVQTKRFANSPLKAYVDGIFISEAIGAQKPDPLFFEKVAFAIPEFDPRRAIVIGDSLTSDIQGANNAGLACIWYNPKGQTAGNQKIDYEVKDYGEILAILEQGDIHEN